MMKQMNRIFIGIMVLFLVLPAIVFPRQETPTQAAKHAPLVPTGSAGVTADIGQLRNKRASVEATTHLNETLRRGALKHYDTAIRDLELVILTNRQLDELNALIQQAPQRVKQIQNEIDKPIPDIVTVKGHAAKASSGDAEKQLREEEANLAASRAAQTKWQELLQQIKTSVQSLPQKIVDTKKRLQEAESQLSARLTGGTDPLLTEAATAERQGNQARLRSDIALYERQLSTYEILVALYTAEQDLAAKEVADRNTKLTTWQDRVQELRREEASQTLSEAEEAKGKAPEQTPIIQEQYDINIRLSRQLEQLTQEESDLQHRLDHLKGQLAELNEDRNMARDRLQYMVLTEAIGLALREQRQALPSSNTFQTASAKNRLRIGKIQETRIELDRMQRDLLNISLKATELFKSLEKSSPELEEKTVSELRALLTNRRDIVDRLQDAYTRIIKILRNIEFIEQQIVLEAKGFADFLDRHLLWLRSSKYLSLNDFPEAGIALSRFLSLSFWAPIFETIRISLSREPALWILGIGTAILLIVGRRKAGLHQTAIAARINNQDRDSLGLTLGALVILIYQAVRWPFLVGFIAFQIHHLSDPPIVSQAIADGLMNAAANLSGFLFLYHLSQRNGLSDLHFQWPEPARATFHRHLRWLMPLVIISGSLIAAMETLKHLEYSDSLARITAIFEGLVSALFFAVILRFPGGIVAGLIKNNPQSWLTRLRYFWYPLAVGVQLFVVVLVALGFYYSAAEIRNLLRDTVGLAILLALFNGIALRGMTLVHRRITRQHREHAEAVAAPIEKPEPKKAKASDTTDQGPNHTPEQNDMGAISRQTRSLLNALTVIFAVLGLWLIWESALPALRVFQEVQLWSYSIESEGASRTVSFTLANLGITGLIIIATVIIYRNLPGLLEILLLNHLPLDPGARYAFSAICRYVIAGIGMIVVFNTIGIQWASIQWLVAALSVGLGFGLQEIVANFISGLIVLFERPVRINDTVTIGDITGTVTRIRIRATTIRDWDRKELIVPNKEFITGRLVNWSLTDNTIRLKVPIGIAYGSDTDLAEKLLLRAARGNRLVLKDPKPLAVFLGFGDNSLNFELRVFIGRIDDWTPMLHNLNRTIDQEFRKAGISISFPQRDVHLDLARGPLEVKLIPDAPKAPR